MLDRRTDRIVYFDYLRIFAIFAVIINHCTISDKLDVRSFEWSVSNTYFSVVQWGVPVFVMISGALFLGREQTLQKIFRKNILRIATAFAFWSALYACWRYFVTHEKNSIREMVLSMIKGHYHMWFLFIIIGLYLIVPLLNKIVEDSKLAVYFVILAFLFTFLFPQMIELIGLKHTGPSEILNEFISKFRLEFVLGYSGYFVLGYLLSRMRINKVAEIVIYLIGICGFVITIVVSAWFARSDISTGIIFDELTVNVLLCSVAVFVFAKQHLNKPFKNEKAAGILSFLSKCTFGVYLVHPLVIDCLRRFVGVSALSFNPIISIPMIALLVFIISMVISAIMNRIPFVKKWFV